MLSKLDIRKILLEKVSESFHEFAFERYQRGTYFFRRKHESLSLESLLINVRLRRGEITCILTSVLDKSQKYNLHLSSNLVNLKHYIQPAVRHYSFCFDNTKESYEEALDEVIKHTEKEIKPFLRKADERLQHKKIIAGLEFIRGLKIDASLLKERYYDESRIIGYSIPIRRPYEYTFLLNILNSIEKSGYGIENELIALSLLKIKMHESETNKMTVQQKLKSILKQQYKNNNDDTPKIELLEGMTHTEIDSLKSHFPEQRVPFEIRNLLFYSRGFKFYPLGEVRFDNYASFGLKNLFPHAIQLVSDGSGNSWVLDIDAQGNWGPVYYVSHNPAVVVKHSNNLKHFLHHVDEFGKSGDESNMGLIRKKIVFDVWKLKNEVTVLNKKGANPENANIDLPDVYSIADLSEKPIRTGFTWWGKYDTKLRIIRPTDAPRWIIGKNKTRLERWLRKTPSFGSKV